MKSPWFAVGFFFLAACASSPDVDLNDEMAKAVDAQEKAFHACYKKHGGGKDVKTALKYRLNFAGAIQFVEVVPETSENSTPGMNECVVGVFKTLKMPAAEGYDGVLGHYTFRYTTR